MHDPHSFLSLGIFPLRHRLQVEGTEIQRLGAEMRLCMDSLVSE